MLTGWYISGSSRYYLDTRGMNRPEGARIEDDWETISNKWYHFGSDGKMQTGWHKLIYTGYSPPNQDNWHYFNSSGVWQTDSDTKGCTEGYNTFNDHVFLNALDNIKYYVNPNDLHVTSVVNGCNLWDSDIVNITRSTDEYDCNIEFKTDNTVSGNVLAITYFQHDRPSEMDWWWCMVLINPNYSVPALTMAHEMGHCLGLTHRIAEKDSVMCIENRTATRPTSKDYTVINHLY